MIKNYFKITLRNLVKNKSHTLINVGGLSVGILCALVIFLIIQFEFSFDTFHEDRENIYRVVRETNRFGEQSFDTGVPAPLPEAFENDFPEAEAVSIVDANFGAPVISAERSDGSIQRFKEENAAFVEQEYFGVFTYNWLAGNSESVLTRPNTVVVSRSFAAKLFGNENPLGKMLGLQTGNKYDLEITGVIEDPPSNSDLPFVVLASYSSASREGNTRANDDWDNTSSSRQCYIKLPDSVTADMVNARMDSFLGKYRDEEAVAEIDFFLQPLSEIHFDTRFGNYRNRVVANEMLMALALIGLFLLITACINFVNLNTAIAVKRSREVGVRKTLGGTKGQLVVRYLGETALVTFISLALALALTEWVLILVRSLMGLPLELNLLTNIPVLLFLAAVFIVTTLSAGLYPAFYISGFSPIEAIRGRISANYGEGLTLRRSLVVVQFVISQMLIIGTITISNQMNYFRNADMGFNKESLVEVPIPLNDQVRLDRFKNELRDEAGIRSVAYSNTSTASGNVWTGNYQLEDRDEIKEGRAHIKFGDENFIPTYGLEVLAGKNIVTSDTVNMYLVNEAFASETGYDGRYDELIGKYVDFWAGEAPIVGVVKNFHTTSLHEEIDPVLVTSRPLYFTAGIKIDMGQVQEALQSAENAFKAAFPDYVFEYTFLDQRMPDFYKRELLTARLMNIFTIIAIIIGCLGLFGLVSYMAATRTKEIGVRKVMGATVTDILKLFGKEFGLLTGISFLIAVPLAWFLMNSWLEDFAYRIDLGPELFILAFAATVFIVLMTVGVKSLNAATSNPVDSLRNE